MQLQKYFTKFLLSKRKRNLSETEIRFSNQLNAILGCNIQNIQIYKEAFSLKANNGLSNHKNYERLEFLGDSILGSIISSHLCAAYPEADEGYLTQMKSKIVSRNNLNKLGEELQLTSLLINTKGNTLSDHISGNLFESLIGAVFMDLQYENCQKIVLEKLLTPSHMMKLERKITSYKSLLLEWSQKKKLSLQYKTELEILQNKKTVFRCEVWIDHKKITNCTETSKKKAEEKAAQRAFYSLNKKEEILENSKYYP